MTPFIVHGLTRSYFTRKVTGYLDYTGRPWRLEPCPPNIHPDASEVGWTGGIPVVTGPDGDLMWDSTAIIEHLDAHTESIRGVLPDDPTLRFLVHLLDDFSDEWFYRPAVGSRWSYPGNTETAGWQIAEELSAFLGFPGGPVRENVVEAMTGSLPKLGVLPGTIDAWMEESVTPWFQALDAHLGVDGYLVGARPSMADFALFGANVAHFVGDPVCREIADEHGPGVVAHTHRLQMPQRNDFGDWFATAEVPDTLIRVIGEAGRHYLPWVAEATVEGAAPVALNDEVSVDIVASPFLIAARGIMLARYVEARSPALDEILERAGVLAHYVDHVDQATEVPDVRDHARPRDNRPYAIN